MAESEDPTVELRGFRPAELSGGRIQLRHDAVRRALADYLRAKGYFDAPK